MRSENRKEIEIYCILLLTDRGSLVLGNVYFTSEKKALEFLKSNEDENDFIIKGKTILRRSSPYKDPEFFATWTVGGSTLVL